MCALEVVAVGVQSLWSHRALTLKGSPLDRVLHWGLMLCGHCLATFTFNHCRNYLKIIKEDNFKNNFTIPNVTFEFIS